VHLPLRARLKHEGVEKEVHIYSVQSSVVPTAETCRLIPGFLVAKKNRCVFLSISVLLFFVLRFPEIVWIEI